MEVVGDQAGVGFGEGNEGRVRAVTVSNSPLLTVAVVTKMSGSAMMRSPFRMLFAIGYYASESSLSNSTVTN